jgi:hypothetical protein
VIKEKISYESLERIIKLPYPPPHFTRPNSYKEEIFWVVMGIMILTSTLSHFEILGWFYYVIGSLIIIGLGVIIHLKQKKKKERVSIDSEIGVDDIYSLHQKKNRSGTHFLTLHLKNEFQRPVGIITKGEFLKLKRLLINNSIPINIY